MQPCTAPASPVARRSLTHARIRIIRELLILGSVCNVGLNLTAHAFVGQALLSFAASNIIAPIGLLAFVITIGAAIFNPLAMKGALYTMLICVVLFFIIQNGQSVISAIQS